MNELNREKWELLLKKFIMKAVERVQPSSHKLGDSMDINDYIKVKIINWKDISKTSYTKGIVMKKSIA